MYLICCFGFIIVPSINQKSKKKNGKFQTEAENDKRSAYYATLHVFSLICMKIFPLLNKLLLDVAVIGCTGWALPLRVAE